MLDLPRPVVCGLITLHRLGEQDGTVPAEEISRDCRIARPLLRQVLRALTRAGLIQGRSDRGYVLTRSPSSITVSEVIEAFRPPRRRSRECEMEYSDCSFRTTCPVAALCREAHEGLQGIFRSFTVADLSREAIPMP